MPGRMLCRSLWDFKVPVPPLITNCLQTDIMLKWGLKNGMIDMVPTGGRACFTELFAELVTEREYEMGLDDLSIGLGHTGTDYGKNDPRPKKDVEFSQTECTHVVLYDSINDSGRLFGGQLVSWIDVAAGACAMRHTGMRMTTASIDNLTFKRGAYLGDIVVLIARMTYVGSTSCEVRVDSYVEDSDGYRRAMNRAFLTYVAIDPDGKPVKIPYGLEVNSVSEMARWDGALLRREYRSSRKNVGF